MEKITRLTIESGTGKDRPTVYISRPSLSQKKLLGTLFATARIKDASVDEAGIVDSIIRLLEKNYYDFDIDKSSPARLDFEHIFETALQKANLELYQKYEETDWDKLTKRLSATAGVVNDGKICFAHFGDCEAFLTRDGRLIEVAVPSSENAGMKNGPSIGSARIFSHITSGSIEPGDLLVFSAENISGRMKKEELRDALLSCSSLEEARGKIRELAEKVPDYSASFVLIGGAPAEEKEESEKDGLIESVFGAPQVHETPVAKSPISGIAGKFPFLAALSKKKKKEKLPEDPEIAPIEEKLAETVLIEDLPLPEEDVAPAKEGKAKKMIPGGKKHRKKPNLAKKLGKLAKKIPKRMPFAGKPVENLSRAMKSWGKKFDKFPMSSKVLLIVCLVLAVLFAQNTLLSAGRKKRQAQLEAYNRSVDSIEKLHSEGLAALIYDDESKAEELLVEAEKMIDQLTRETKEQREQIRLLVQENTVHLNRLRKIISVNEPVLLADLENENARGLAMASGGLYAFDGSDVYAVSEEGYRKASLSPLEGLEYIAPYGTSSSIFYRDGETLAKFDYNSGKFLPLSLFSDHDLSGATDIDSYGQKVYILSPDNDQIFKYYQGASGFDRETAWITDNTDVSSGVSLAIDSAIYVLMADGRVARLYQGKKAAFETEQIEPPLEGPVEIYTDYGVNFIYILDAPTKRLIVMDKDGNLVQQYQSEAFEGLKGMAIDEKAGKAYLLVGSKVYEISIR